MNKLQERNKLAHDNSVKKFEEAVKLYITGEYSLTVLSKTFKFGRTHFSKYLKSKGIAVVNKQNICKFNESIFDTIDTEEKAYWLGFLFADGYVSYRDNTVELSLKLEDKEHLEKFKKFLKWTGTVRTDDFRCRLSVTNKHLKEVLIKYGCTPKKSLTLQYPMCLSIELLKHFNRGYIDGDGCVHISKNNNYYLLEILGTKPFITAMIKNSNWKINKLMHDKRHNDLVFHIRYSGKTSLTILTQLYENAGIYLDRKYLKYKRIAVLASNS